MALGVLLATQRTGTNMLRQILATHPGIVSFGEVFNNKAPAQDRMSEGVPRYDEYMIEKLEMEPKSGLPGRRSELVDGYFDTVASMAGKPGSIAVFGVKYNSLHHADEYWRAPSRPPLMLSLFRRRKVRVLHLVREDLVATVYSQMRAEWSSTYVVPVSRPVDKIRFRVDPRRMVERTRTLKKDGELVRGWLCTSRLNVLEVCYEDLFLDAPGSKLDKSRFDSIAEFLGVDPEGFELQPRTRKIAPVSFKEELENYSEVEEAFSGTEFAGALERHR